MSYDVRTAQRGGGGIARRVLVVSLCEQLSREGVWYRSCLPEKSACPFFILFVLFFFFRCFGMENSCSYAVRSIVVFEPAFQRISRSASYFVFSFSVFFLLFSMFLCCRGIPSPPVLLKPAFHQIILRLRLLDKGSVNLLPLAQRTKTLTNGDDIGRTWVVGREVESHVHHEIAFKKKNEFPHNIYEES